jgi:hypothetical protein
MADTAGQPGEPGQPGQPGTAGGGTGGTGGAGGRGGAGGVPGARNRRARLILYLLTLTALFAAAVAFTVAIWQARNATAQARHVAAALTAEVHAHCVSDATTSNRQRRLDLGLITSDNKFLTVLNREAERPASVHDENLITAQTAWLIQVLRVREGDLPPYRDPSRC